LDYGKGVLGDAEETVGGSKRNGSGRESGAVSELLGKGTGLSKNGAGAALYQKSSKVNEGHMRHRRWRIQIALLEIAKMDHNLIETTSGRSLLCNRKEWSNEW
jgi:hypothetical protein